MKNKKHYLSITIITIFCLTILFGVFGLVNAALEARCQALPNVAEIKQTVNFIANPTGGTGSYNYIWSGDCFAYGNSPVCTNTFYSPGTYYAKLTVVSGSETSQQTICPIQVRSPCYLNSYRACFKGDIYWYDSCGNIGEKYRDCDPQLGCQNGQCLFSKDNSFEVACLVSPNPVNPGRVVTFSASVINLNTADNANFYVYRWSKDCVGDSKNCNKTFTAPGTYTADLTVISGSERKSTSCSVNIIQSGTRYLSCYNNNLFWFDFTLGLQEKFQDCGTDYCVNYGPSYCSANNVYAKQICHKRGCANSACYDKVDYNSTGLIQTCGPNQTCQNGQCQGGQQIFQQQNLSQNFFQNTTTKTNINSYTKKCFGNSLYLYDAYGTIKEVRTDCRDSNDCTKDLCQNDSCFHKLKCDRSTCPENSKDYCDNCSHIRDKVCNCGETSFTSPDDCGGEPVETYPSISGPSQGLVISLLAKKGKETFQWSKSLTLSLKESFDFLIVVSNQGENAASNSVLKITLPDEISFGGDLEIDGSPSVADIKAGVVLGSLTPKSVKTIIFKANAIVQGETIVGANVTSDNLSAADFLKVEIESSRVELATIGSLFANLTKTNFGFVLFLMGAVIVITLILRIAYTLLQKSS